MKNFLCSIAILFTCSPIYAQHTVADWQAKLQTAKHDTTKLLCYARISEKSYVTDSSIHYANIGLMLGKNYPLSFYNVWLLLHKQYAYTLQGKNDSALVYSQKAFAWAKKIKSDHLIKLAGFFVLKNQNAKKTIASNIESYYEFVKNQDFNESNIGDKEVLLIVYNRIILDLVTIRQFEKAYRLSDQSKKYVTTTIDTMRYLYRKSTILAGDIKSNLHIDNPKVLNKLYQDYFLLYEKAKILYDKHPSLRVIVGCMMCMWKDINMEYSRVLRYKKDYKTALIYAKKTFALAKLTDNKYYINQSYIELGLSYNGIGEFQKAIFALNKSLEVYQQGDFEETLLINNYYGLGEAYKGIGDYKKGYNYTAKALALSNKYWGISQQMQTAEMDYLFELSKKQSQIAVQEFENKFKEERIRVEQKQKTIVFVLLLLSLGLLIWALRSYHKQKRLSILLAEQSDVLKEANQTKDKIFAVLGHDLRNPINELKTILMLFHSRDITPMKMKELVQSLSLKIEVVQEMMNNLLQWSLLELKHQGNAPQMVFANRVIEKVIHQLKASADKKQLSIEASLPAVQILVREEDLDIIIRNLLSNAIKFTPNGGTIRIEVLEKSDFIEILCTDTGIGIPTNTLETTLHTFPIQRKGTEGEVGSGLGLKITKELITKNHGKLLVHSDNNQGTEIAIYFSKNSNSQNENSMPEFV